MRKRVPIACAVVHEPGDRAASLPKFRDKVVDFGAGRAGQTIVIATHADSVASACDRTLDALASNISRSKFAGISDTEPGTMPPIHRPLKPSNFAAAKGNSVRTPVMIAALAAGVFCSAPEAAVANSAGHVTGIGGIIVVSKNPRALAAWYRDVLGISLESWGGAMFRYNLPGHPPYTVWSAFSNGAKEFAHSHRDFMLNLSVDDLDALCSRLKTKRVPIYERESTPYGKFASVVDPDGTKIELWQAPKR